MKWWARFRNSVTSLSAEDAALLLIMGMVLSVFPIVGCPTILCLGVALGFRLNVAVLQLVNNMTAPLQWALWVPLEHAGARLCSGWHIAGSSLAAKAGVAVLHAVAGWVFICVPLGIVAYGFFVLVIQRRRWNAPESTT